MMFYDAFGLESAETYGLDYESAREATPRWYGVSFGNGNDGVGHMWPDYYVRTADPWLLAGAAMVANWNDKAMREHAVANCEIDGEAEYGISATILDPPDDDSDDSFYTEAAYGHIEEASDGLYTIGGRGLVFDTEAEAARAYCDENGIEPASWSEFNGAWIICEVFPVDMEDEHRSGAQRYDSLNECFNEADMKEAESI